MSKDEDVATATKRSPCIAGRSSNQAMERGPEPQLGLPMETLTYRGKDYSKKKQALNKQLIQLTYRRNIYTQRKTEAAKDNALCTYRGVQYHK